CRSGDTFTDGSVNYAMTSIFVPEPVISYTITSRDTNAAQNLSKALLRFGKEDPTFLVTADAETGETVISGMGELHLDVYVERIRREYRVPVEISPPRVAYRETITRAVPFNYTHKKQTGGAGQFGRIQGVFEPIEGAGYEFVDKIRGGSVPREFIPSVDKGFRAMLEKGRLIEAPVVGVRAVLMDGNHHAVDSSDMAFQAAARGAWREAFDRAAPVILEPIMRVDVEGPSEFHGQIVATLMQRRGRIIGAAEEVGFSSVDAEVPLAEMFGYSTALRSATQGKAEFTMEFCRYERAPQSVAEELTEKYQAERKAARR
ncbi:MAG: elongation factor G, partial [Deltaproteobacteria bacterium]|nr:elongation factor G [Deltaproteobacteria bacterium]